MEKNVASAVMPPLTGQSSPEDKIWCIHYECYKFIKVCNRCRVRIRCINYEGYWQPGLDL